MFRNLPPAEFLQADLERLGDRMISPELSPRAPEPAESKLPAGYTFLGQFITHDITFDPVSSLQRENDPDSLVNFRTPRLDLDCVYGRGPADQPYLYAEDGIQFVLGNRLVNEKDWDLPRLVEDRTDREIVEDAPARTSVAIIGDPRNDENAIIGQLHAIFLRLHNRQANKRGGSADFATVQQQVRWLYQWVVIYDFLQRIVNKQTFDDVLPHVAKGTNVVTDPPQLRFYKPRFNAFIPIEFSAAALRFGHATIRQQYKLNKTEMGGGPFLMFAKTPEAELGGHKPLNPNWFIEWSLFFQGIGSEAEDDKVQRARRIAPSLAAPLSDLRGMEDMKSLARRNLIRGWRLGLPSGQVVAAAMGEEPISDEDLKIEGAFANNAPLWYYILAEAETKNRGEQLGPVGGRIVMETIVGLLMADGHSFLRQHPQWKPRKNEPEKFGIADLILEARTT